MTGIYEIRCTVNGKRYIGSSATIDLRFISHRSALRCGRHHNRPLQSAYQKYGADAFEFVIVEEGLPVDALIAAEQRRIDEARAMGEKLFNVRAQADSPRGVRHTEESKRKIGNAHRGKVVRPESRALIRTARALQVITPETCEKLAASGRLRSPVLIQKMLDASRAVWLARTACKRGHVYTPETTYLRKGGARGCLICRRMNQRTSDIRRGHTRAA